MAKPSSKPDWTVGNPSFGTVTIEPSAGKKQTGWAAEERPAYEYMNWLFYNLDEWIDYFETETDALIAGNLDYDVIVGAAAGATHATLAAAVADGTLATGVKVLILDSVGSLGTTIQLTKNQWEIHFKPGVTYTDGGAGTGIQISADNCKIIGGRFTGFTTAFTIDAGSDYNMLRDMWFSGNTTEINDLASTSSIAGTITE